MPNFKTGLILEQPKVSDWVVGGFTPLGSKILNPRGIWMTPDPVEYQAHWGFDRMACVSYSLLNCLEALHYYGNGHFINFSDRFLARASGTTKQGNHLSEVFDTARNLGLVTEDYYPDTDLGWNEYYKDIPKETYNKAKEFLTEWSLYREWVDTQDKELIFNKLYEAPLQVTVLYSTGNGLLNPTSSTGVKYNHAVMLYGAKWKEYWMIFDHYEQVYKKYAWDYEFGTILKPSLIKKLNNYMFKKDHAYQLVQGEGQKTGLYIEDKGLYIGDSVDVLVNSAMRLKTDYIPTPTPVTLEMWNSVDKFDMSGNKL